MEYNTDDHKRPLAGFEAYQRLEEIAKIVSGSIISHAKGCYLVHQAMSRRFVVIWTNAVYIVMPFSSEISVFSSSVVDDVVNAIGGVPPYSYVEVQPNGYRRIYHN